MDSNGQSTAFTARALPDTDRDCFRLTHEASGRIEEFPSLDGRPRAAVCPIE